MIEVVCGVIRDDAGRILACRRSAHQHLAGLWEFPGGKIEKGESGEEALSRELQEELGICVDVGGQLEEVVEWTDGEVSIRLSGFYCEISEGEPELREHSELRWCALDELGELKWAEADLPMVAEITGKEAV